MSYAEVLINELRAHSNVHRAVGMRAYMRNQFSFLGISSPERKSIVTQFLKNHTVQQDALNTALSLWEQEEREFQYAACDILTKYAKQIAFDQLQYLEPLIISKSWWDTVDYLVPKVFGSVLKPLPKQLIKMCERWIRSENIWLQRSAIIVQLGYKENTNIELLFSLIQKRATSKEFFVQKGSGWALRELSYRYPNEVRQFITDNNSELSALTKREGGKYC